MKHTPSGFGKNNWDRLEAAGCIGGEGEADNLKVKTEARKAELAELDEKVKKVEIFLASLYIMPREQQLRRLDSTTVALKKLLAQKLPVGAKRHIETCFNEVQSLKEGVASTNSKLDKQTLALTASAKARTEIQAMIDAAENRLEKVQADSSDDDDLDEFYRKARDVIKKHETESTKLAPIANKPYVIARVPVVPLGSFNVSKLSQLGFKAESLGGYPVIHNQLVLGINPKKVGGGGEAEKYADMTRTMKQNGVDGDDIRKIENRIAGYDRDINKINKEIPELDEVKHKAFIEKKKAEVEGLTAKREALREQMQSLVKKSGINYEEYLSLGQRMRRSDNVAADNIYAEADRIRIQLEKQLRIKLSFVSSTEKKTNKAWDKDEKTKVKPMRRLNGAWFWLMPEREVNALARSSLSGRADVKAWGFAFN